MKTCFRSAGAYGSVTSSKGLPSRQPSFSCPLSRTAPPEVLTSQKPRTAGYSPSFLQSCAKTPQVLWRRQCSSDGSADSNSWGQDAADLAPMAGAEDHDQLHEEWKALQQRLGSHYAASCQPELHEPYRFSVEESVDMDDVPAPWAPLLPFPAASPPLSPPESPPSPPSVHHEPHCSCDQEGREVWSVPKGRRDFLDGQLMWNDLSQVYVIIYDGGDATEGIYSWRSSQDDGPPQDTIIAFESMADAQRYAGQLAGRTEPVGVAKPMVPKELLNFCVMAGYNCRLEPQGTLLSPCEMDVPLSDWERGLSPGPQFATTSGGSAYSRWLAWKSLAVLSTQVTLELMASRGKDGTQAHPEAPVQEPCSSGACSPHQTWDKVSPDDQWSVSNEAASPSHPHARDQDVRDLSEVLGEVAWGLGDQNILPRDPCADSFCSPDLTLNEARSRLERLLAYESEDRF